MPIHFSPPQTHFLRLTIAFNYFLSFELTFTSSYIFIYIFCSVLFSCPYFSSLNLLLRRCWFAAKSTVISGTVISHSSLTAETPSLKRTSFPLQHGWTQKHRDPFTYHQLGLHIAHLTARIPTSLFNRVLEIFSKRNDRIRNNLLPQWRQTPAYNWRSIPYTAVLLCSLFNSQRLSALLWTFICLTAVISRLGLIFCLSLSQAPYRLQTWGFWNCIINCKTWQPPNTKNHRVLLWFILRFSTENVWRLPCR